VIFIGIQHWNPRKDRIMIESILNVLTDDRTIIVGSLATISEVFVIIVNTRKRIKKAQLLTACSGSCGCSKFKKILWVMNPINLLRQP